MATNSPLKFCIFVVRLIMSHVAIEDMCIELSYTERKQRAIQNLESYHCVKEKKSSVENFCDHQKMSIYCRQSAKFDKAVCQGELFVDNPELREEICNRCGYMFRSFTVS